MPASELRLIQIMPRITLKSVQNRYDSQNTLFYSVKLLLCPFARRMGGTSPLPTYYDRISKDSPPARLGSGYYLCRPYQMSRIFLSITNQLMNCNSSSCPFRRFRLGPSRRHRHEFGDEVEWKLVKQNLSRFRRPRNHGGEGKNEIREIDYTRS